MNEELDSTLPSPEPKEERAPVPDPEWGYFDLMLVMGLAIPFFLAGFASGLALVSMLGITAKGLRVLLPQFLGYIVALAPVWLVFAKKFERNPLDVLRLRVGYTEAARSFRFGLILAFLVLALSAALRMPRIETPMEELLSDTASLALAAIFGVTLGPWFEELLFRGLLQPLLSRSFGVVAGIVLAALPFAVMHGPQYAWSWRHVLLITCAGAAFGWHRYRTNSTGAAVVMHAGYNAALFILFIAAKWAGARMPQVLEGAGW